MHILRKDIEEKNQGDRWQPAFLFFCGDKMITDADAASCDADECCETLHLLQT